MEESEVVVGFARAWGAGCIVVVNLFALRATDPMALLRAPDPMGPGNNDAIAAAAHAARHRAVICAWGSPSNGALAKLVRARAESVVGVLRNDHLYSLGTAKDGSPRHPLYLRADETPRAWRMP